MHPHHCILATGAALALLATPVAADTFDASFVEAETLITLDSGLTPEPLEVGATGTGVLDLGLGLAGSNATTAGLVSFDGLVNEAILITLAFPALGDGTTITFDVPTDTISFAGIAAGVTDNLVTGGTFSQSDVDFTFDGFVSGTIDNVDADITLPFEADLSQAEVIDGAGFTDAMVSTVGGIATVNLPLALDLEVPLDIDGGSATLPLTIGGNVVLQAAVPEPTSLVAIASLACACLRRRRSA